MTDQAPQSAPESGWAPPTPTRSGPMAGVHYAGFWVRFLAFVLDAIILGVISAALTPIVGSQVTITGSTYTINYTANAYSALIGLVYFVGLWSWRGQTIGMIPFGMQVVGVADGKKIDPLRAILRYVGFIIAAIPLLLGLVWAAFDARKQGWHDKIAGTVVIRPN